MNKYIDGNKIKYSYLVRNRGEIISYVDRGLFKVIKPVRYYIDYKHKNEYIDIPEDYIFDFNSSPCWGHCIVDKDEFMIALIHDRLFDRDGKVIIKDPNNLSPRFKQLQKHGYGFSHSTCKGRTEFLYNRKFADLIWLEGAKEEAKQIKRRNKDRKCFLGYLAIRLGGTRSFK